jgi:hypothetical protein
LGNKVIAVPPSLKALRVGRNVEVGTALLQFRALTQQFDRTRICLQESDVAVADHGYFQVWDSEMAGWPSWLSESKAR